MASCQSRRPLILGCSFWFLFQADRILQTAHCMRWLLLQPEGKQCLRSLDFANQRARLRLYPARTASLMNKGGQAVTAFSVQRRPLLSLGGSCRGGGLCLASTAGEKQGDENKRETMKWFEFFHGASVSNGHATSFAQLQAISNPPDAVSKMRQIRSVFGKNLTRRTRQLYLLSWKRPRIDLADQHFANPGSVTSANGVSLSLAPA